MKAETREVLMNTLILENFRCFAERHEIPVRPLTLLVGENSTGKTSFLAAVRAAYDLSDQVDFNEDPFHLGSYDQVAYYREGSAELAKSFVIGQEFLPLVREENGHKAIRIESRFRETKSQPVIQEYLTSSEGRILHFSWSPGRGRIEFSTGDGGTFTEESSDEDFPFIDLGDLVTDGTYDRLYNRLETAVGEDDLEIVRRLIGHVPYNRRMKIFGPSIFAFAPIRSSPRRTYDPIRERRDPEGSHIPMMLHRVMEAGRRSGIRRRLEDFGEASGLYSSLSIRKLGEKGSDPFQIEVKSSSDDTARNIIDVGYGISQAIPIIADCVRAGRGSALLVQQPEIHLHPRAQAAMGSFFGKLVADRRNRLVIETHSDHLVDRIRLDVRDGVIQSKDVMILYFENGQSGANIHPIELDSDGSLERVPARYREFFLAEDRRFFGID